MKTQAGNSLTIPYSPPDDTPPDAVGVLVMVGPQQITSTATDGAFVFPGVVTAGWAPGAYHAYVYSQTDTDRTPVTDFPVTVTPDPMQQTTATDPRPQAVRDLAAVRAMLSGRATDGVAEYQIAGRMLKHIPIQDLLILEKRFAAEVAQKNGAYIKTVKVTYH